MNRGLRNRSYEFHLIDMFMHQDRCAFIAEVWKL